MQHMVTDTLWDQVARHTDLLLRHASALDDAAVSAASRCSGWTRGHVLTHLARNADALGRVAQATAEGRAVAMYSSDDARDRELEEGVERAVGTQLDDLRSASRDLAAHAERLGPEHADVTVERTPGSDIRIPVGKVALVRLNEVVLHHIDLDIGFEFEDLDDLTANLLLDLAVARAPQDPGLTIQTVEGDEYFVGDGSTTVRGSRRAMLAFLTRQQTSGVTTRTGELP